MKPYSKDLRLRVLSAVDAGTPREEVAKTFSVSMPTIKRWLKRRRETGDVKPEPIPGRPPRKGAMLEEWLPKHLEANDDLTLEEHREAFDEEARGLWRWLASRFDARRLVFVDESGFNTSMTRLRARAPKGKRAHGKVPRNRGKNTTLIAAITLEGAMGQSMTIEGATDALAFEAYVEHFLV